MTATIAKASEVREPAAASASGLRPLRSRYVVAVLLPLVAIMAVSGWYGAVWSSKEQTYLNMPEHTLPAVVVLNGRPGTYWVYGQGATEVTGIRVTDANGRVIPVQTLRPRSVEDYGGLSPKEIARFEAVRFLPPTGPIPLRVEVTGSGTIRIGERSPTFLGWERWGMAALMTVNVGAAVAIIVVPVARRRRRRAA